MNGLIPNELDFPFTLRQAQGERNILNSTALTSTGVRIQGEWIFNACSDAVTSDDALADPYEDLLFTDNLFPWPAIKGTIVDTHFYQKDRMGRAMTYVARLLRDGITRKALAIGIDEGTSLVINQRGMAQVMANDEQGSAYLILGDHQPEVCERNTAISFSNCRIWRIRNGKAFELNNLPTTGYTSSVSSGGAYLLATLIGAELSDGSETRPQVQKISTLAQIRSQP